MSRLGIIFKYFILLHKSYPKNGNCTYFSTSFALYLDEFYLLDLFNITITTDYDEKIHHFTY